MKKRVFYVINLDRGRIWILTTLLVSTLLFAFATGFRVGAARPGDSGANAGTIGDRGFGGPEELELAELGPTTGQQESLDALDPLEANGDVSADAALENAGHSPFEKRPGLNGPHANDGAFARDNPGSQFDSTATGAAERQRDLDERRRLAAAREAAEKRAKAERERRAAAAKSLAAKRKAEAERKSKNSAQKKGKALAKKNSAQSAKSKQSKKTAAPSVAKKSGADKSVASAKPAGNPRSALLDTSSGKLRMANISKQPPGATASSQKKSAAKASTDARPAPAKKESATKGARKTYSLQIGAFSSRAAGDRMAATLKKQGFHPYIVESRGKFIVRVGKSDTAKGLWKLETRLRKNQYAPMRVSTKAR